MVGPPNMMGLRLISINMIQGKRWSILLRLMHFSYINTKIYNMRNIKLTESFLKLIVALISKINLSKELLQEIGDVEPLEEMFQQSS